MVGVPEKRTSISSGWIISEAIWPEQTLGRDNGKGYADALSYSSSCRSLCPRFSRAFKLFCLTSLRSTGEKESITHCFYPRGECLQPLAPEGRGDVLLACSTKLPSTHVESFSLQK